MDNSSNASNFTNTVTTTRRQFLQTAPAAAAAFAVAGHLILDDAPPRLCKRFLTSKGSLPPKG